MQAMCALILYTGGREITCMTREYWRFLDESFPTKHELLYIRYYKTVIDKLSFAFRVKYVFVQVINLLTRAML